MNICIIAFAVISTGYIYGASRSRHIHIKSVADIREDTARAQASAMGVGYATIDEVLADPSIEIVINSTVPNAHVITYNLGVYGGSFYARQVVRGNVVIRGGRAHGIGEHAQPSDDTTLAAMHEVCAILPALRTASLIRNWSRVEGVDSDLIIGSSKTTPGLLHDSHFSGDGALLVSGADEVLAKLIGDGESATPLSAFAVDRFLNTSSLQPANHH